MEKPEEVMPIGRLYARITLKWWAVPLIKLYQWWIWVCPWEPRLEDVRAFTDWLMDSGGIKIEAFMGGGNGENSS